MSVVAMISTCVLYFNCAGQSSNPQLAAIPPSTLPGGKTCTPAMCPGGGGDVAYLRLGRNAMQRITPALTCTAASELAGLANLLSRYMSVTDQLNALVPPTDDPNENKERIRGLPLPPVLQEHARELARQQGRYKRDIALAAARVASVPNTNPAVVRDAMRAIAAGSPSGVRQLQELLRAVAGSSAVLAAPDDISTRVTGLGSIASRDTITLPVLTNRALAVMFLQGTSAGVCAMWPRCLSLLGGTGLQVWDAHMSIITCVACVVAMLFTSEQFALISINVS
jgi:hypothetical protein